MKILAIVFTLVIFVQTSAQAALFDNLFNSPNWQTGSLKYGKTASEEADLYLPNEGANNPALIIVHGGGWAAGDKAGHKFYAEKFARQGIAVVSINYRLIGVAPWPAQIQDVQLAVRWMRANAKTLRIDPKRICALGDSAGGHLALMLGSLKSTLPGDRADLFADQSPSVGCVVDMFGPTDLANPNFNKDGRALVGLFGGKTVSDAPELYAKASPIKIATAKTAPTLIVQGTTDSIVPLAQSTDFASVLSGLGVQNQVILFNGGHWFDKIKGDPNKNSIDSFMVAWVAAMLNSPNLVQ